MGGEGSGATEEDSAFLSLIVSNVIWREKRGVGSATHISLAELQRRGMIQREGTLRPVRPRYTAGPSAGSWKQLCAQKVVTWPSGGCPEREATGLKFWRRGFCEKAPLETGGHPPIITWPPHSPCRRTGRVVLAPCPNAFLAHADILYRFCLRNGSGR